MSKSILKKKNDDLNRVHKADEYKLNQRTHGIAKLNQLNEIVASNKPVMCSGQLFADNDLSFSSFVTGGSPSLAACGLRWL